MSDDSDKNKEGRVFFTILGLFFIGAGISGFMYWDESITSILFGTAIIGYIAINGKP